MLVWLSRHSTVARIGIEGSGSCGFPLAQALLAAGCDVVDVPPTLTKEERKRRPQRGKDDDHDAEVIARACASEERLPAIRADQHARDLRLLCDRRKELVSERTAQINRAHSDLVLLDPGVRHRLLSIRATQRTLDAIAGDGVHVRLLRERLERVIGLYRQEQAVAREIRELMDRRPPLRTMAIHGVGERTCAEIIGEIGDITRYRSRDAFARDNASAPIPASSGQTLRVRSNPGGNRQLNKLLHRIAIVQFATYPPGQAYYAKKRAEGKTAKEAIRCLKRRISDRVYVALREDHRLAT